MSILSRNVLYTYYYTGYFGYLNIWIFYETKLKLSENTCPTQESFLSFLEKKYCCRTGYERESCFDRVVWSVRHALLKVRDNKKFSRKLCALLLKNFRESPSLQNRMCSKFSVLRWAKRDIFHHSELTFCSFIWLKLMLSWTYDAVYTGKIFKHLLNDRN